MSLEVHRPRDRGSNQGDWAARWKAADGSCWAQRRVPRGTTGCGRRRAGQSPSTGIQSFGGSLSIGGRNEVRMRVGHTSTDTGRGEERGTESERRRKQAVRREWWNKFRAVVSLVDAPQRKRNLIYFTLALI